VAAVVLRRDRDTLHEEMTISQRGQAQPANKRDPADFVLVPPLSPEHPQPHIEDTAMLRGSPPVKPKWPAVDGGGEAGPVGHGRKLRNCPDSGVEHSREESCGSGKRASFGQRPARADIAISDGEQRFQLVLAGPA
jgi:hypothetical protein